VVSARAAKKRSATRNDTGKDAPTGKAFNPKLKGATFGPVQDSDSKGVQVVDLDQDSPPPKPACVGADSSQRQPSRGSGLADFQKLASGEATCCSTCVEVTAPCIWPCSNPQPLQPERPAPWPGRLLGGHPPPPGNNKPLRRRFPVRYTCNESTAGLFMLHKGTRATRRGVQRLIAAYRQGAHGEKARVQERNQPGLRSMPN